MKKVWEPFEGTIEAVRERFPEPLLALARGETAALVFRGAFPREHCNGLVERFFERGHLYDPRTSGEKKPKRVDIGTSLGTYGPNLPNFFAHAAATHDLFRTLFDGFENPVKTIYDTLIALALGKQVKTAREPDGQIYGPAIFRTYYDGLGHGPHFDSARKREKLFHLQVSRFKHQFSAVICFQNSEVIGECGEPFLYQCPWKEDTIQPHIVNKTFHEFASQNKIPRLQVKLEPGDLYVFSTENIHEVPLVSGKTPRIVLATFFAMSPDDDEVFVWS